jgi:hypothetical protein
MEHYVTIFDSYFLPQGLTLHESLERHAGAYTLWVLCMDLETFEVLDRLHLPNTKLLRLADLEDDRLRSVKADRNNVEYCWTLTPFAPQFVFAADDTVKRVTYLDADLVFLRDPAAIHREFDASGKHVLLTEHAYAPEHDQVETSGRFCVQFITFTRQGEPARSWWERRCLEWCYARIEDGKFGDQKYLDDWPQRFGALVHVLQHQNWALGPWNTTRFSHKDAVFYHFHGLRLLSPTVVDLGHYMLPRKVVRALYHPYFASLARAIAKLAAVGVHVQPQQGHPGRLWGVRTIVHRLRHHGLRYGLRRLRRL